MTGDDKDPEFFKLPNADANLLTSPSLKSSGA
jgi:hypothetical protein